MPPLLCCWCTVHSAAHDRATATAEHHLTNSQRGWMGTLGSGGGGIISSSEILQTAGRDAFLFTYSQFTDNWKYSPLVASSSPVVCWHLAVHLQNFRGREGDWQSGNRESERTSERGEPNYSAPNSSAVCLHWGRANPIIFTMMRKSKFGWVILPLFLRYRATAAAGVHGRWSNGKWSKVISRVATCPQLHAAGKNEAFEVKYKYKNFLS